MNKLTKIALVSTLSLTLVGCGKIPTLTNGEEAVFTLTDKKISVNTLYESLKNKYGASTLIDLIDKTILNDKYKETDEEKAYIQDNIDTLKSSAESYGVSFEYLISYYYGVANESELNEVLSLSYKREFAVKDYLKNKLKEDELKKYYETNIYGEVDVKHILISPKTKDGMTEEQVKEAEKKALNKAKKVIEKLESGEKFDELVKKYSDDTASVKNNGDLGWITVGDTVKEFQTAAFELEKGKYTTSPVKTQYGYHIIYKVDEKDKPSYKEALNDIKDSIVKEKLEKDPSLSYSTLDEIRKEAGLNIVDDDLKNDYKKYINNLITNSKSNAQ